MRPKAVFQITASILARSSFSAAESSETVHSGMLTRGSFIAASIAGLRRFRQSKLGGGTAAKPPESCYIRPHEHPPSRLGRARARACLEDRRLSPDGKAMVRAGQCRDCARG